MAPIAVSAEQSDLVFLSQNILTGNPDMPIARSMAVSGDRITCVSESDACRSEAGPDAVVIDNCEATIMAGLIDTHLHTRLTLDTIETTVAGPLLRLPPWSGGREVYGKPHR